MEKRVLTDVLEKDVDRIIFEFMQLRFSVTKEQQPNGAWTITAIGPTGDEVPAPRGPAGDEEDFGKS